MIYEFDITTDTQKRTFKDWLELKNFSLTSYPGTNKIYYTETPTPFDIGFYYMIVAYNYGEFLTQVHLAIDDDKFTAATISDIRS